MTNQAGLSWAHNVRGLEGNRSWKGRKEIQIICTAAEIKQTNNKREREKLVGVELVSAYNNS